MVDPTKKFIKLKYGNSTAWLKALREIEVKIASIPMGDKVRTLRKNELKKWKESRQAALLCEGLSQRYGFTIDFAIDEESDFDNVVRWFDGEWECYAPLQLKEFVPENLNPTDTLQKLIDKLVLSYPDSKDLIVGIHINRIIVIKLDDLVIPKDLHIAELWVFGSLAEDQSKWFLYGDLCTYPVMTHFFYPK